MGMEFDGAVDAVNLGSAAAIDDIWAGGGTISFWAYPRSYGETGTGRVLNKNSTTTSTGGWALFFDTSTSSFNMLHGFTTTNGDWRTATSSVTLNEWVHVTVRYDSDSSANDPVFTFNGVIMALTENVAPSGSSDSDASSLLTMGNYQISDTIRAFDGYLADVRFYDRELSDTEVEIIAGSSNEDDIFDGLAAWWPLDDSADISGQDFLSELSENGTGGISTTLVVDVPGHSDGDTLVLVLASSGDSGGSAENITTPSGWTHINSGQTDLVGAASLPSVWVYRRTASSEPATYTVTGDQSCTKLGTMMSFKGIATTEDVSSNINTGSGTAPLAPSVTAGGDAMAIRISVSDSVFASVGDSGSFPSGANSRKAFQENDAIQSNGCSLLVGTELVDTGSTGTYAFSISNSEEWGCLTITFLGGQGSRADYLSERSDNSLDSNIQGAPVFREEHPDIQYRSG